MVSKPNRPADDEVWLPNTREHRQLAAQVLPAGEDVRLLETDSGEMVVVLKLEDCEPCLAQ